MFQCVVLCFRRERAQSRSNMRRPSVFSVPQSPTSSWSPTPSPTGHLPCHVYPTPPIDEPLDLIKKPRKEPERTEEKTKSTTAINQVISRGTIIIVLTTWKTGFLVCVSHIVCAFVISQCSPRQSEPTYLWDLCRESKLSGTLYSQDTLWDSACPW